MQQQMRRREFTIGLLSIGLFVAVALTANPAQAASKGPYYAEPAWDQKLEPAQRFLVLSDWNSAAVLDKETGLVWEKTPRIAPEDWFLASERCALNAIGGRKGWRLPSIIELTSLIDPSVGVHPGLALPPGHPFNVGLSNFTFWSATTHARTPTDAWSVQFADGDNDGNNGDVESDTTKDGSNSATRTWCVRGGQNHADAY